MYSNQLTRRNNPETFKHICAVISSRGNVLGIGNNHCINGLRGATKHAEHHALENATDYVIRKYGRDRLLKGSLKVDLIVVRDTGSNSRPCNNCITKHIANNPYFNVRHVYYSHENSGLIQTNTNKLFEGRHEHYSRFYANINNIAINVELDCGGDIGLDIEDGVGDDSDGLDGECKNRLSRLVFTFS
jgi:hypothetical protein